MLITSKASPVTIVGGGEMPKTVWEEIYEKGLLEVDPDLEISKVVEMFEQENVRRILDLGSGAGRHTVYLANKGFDVYGLDSAPTGLAHTIKVLGEKGLVAHLTLHDMATLPYDDEYFDAVISVKVIHHNSLERIRDTVNEIRRVLKMRGLAWISIPVSKNEPSTKQEEIEPGTFLPLDGREKGLPHHYFKMEEIPHLFSGFSVMDLHVDTTNHYSLMARKS
jgi:cyclopropane fatty-acyl-phospholipid synthase-like methyltransferase